MKKFTVCGAAVALCCLAGNVQAQEPEYPASASTEVFDFTPWNDDKLLLLFAQAADEGRKYPTKHCCRCISHPSVVDEHTDRTR